VWFVDLGALRDRTLVPQAVATVLVCTMTVLDPSSTR
jgi:hypothetical protein